MYNIKDFGAKEGILCTTSIQAAIDKCAIDGGGRVVVPSGCYTSGTIYLKDNVELNLQSGAVLKASTNLDDYNTEDAYVQNWGYEPEGWRGKHFIIALECDNVSVTGNGIIDGSGSAFFGTERIMHGGYEWEGGYVTSKDKENLRPGQLVCFIECSNIKLKDVTLKNMPCWGFYLHGCEYVQVHGIKVINPYEYVNTDGIDIDCCRYVTVSDCIINTGDDAIAIRCDSNRLKNPKPCEYITVTNCVLSSNSSIFRIGVGSGEIRHVRVSNIVVSRAGNFVICSTTYMGEGKAIIEDIGFSDISANNVCRVTDCLATKGTINKILMQNMYICAKSGIGIAQNESGIISNIVLRNIQLEVKKKMKKEEKYLVNISKVNDVELDSLNISCNEKDWEEIVYMENSEKITIKNCNF